MQNDITLQIINGNFDDAKQSISSKSITEIYDFLMHIAWHSGSISVYGFTAYLISLNEQAVIHDIAADLLALPLSHIEGAYALSLFHARKALALDPKNLKYKEFLLFFHIIPDCLIGKEEAISIAQDILKEDPENKAAQEIIGKYY